jgi:hypothetical protein
MIEIDPLIAPASILMPNRRTLRMMPIMPQSVPYAPRTRADETSPPSFMKIFESRVIKLSLRERSDVKKEVS